MKAGSQEDAQRFIDDYLSELTDHSFVADDKGYIHISEMADSDRSRKKQGNRLVAEIIGDEKDTMTIVFRDEKYANSSAGPTDIDAASDGETGCDVRVIIGGDMEAEVPTQRNNRKRDPIVPLEMPPHIIAGHEMIHAWHAMNGHYADDVKELDNPYNPLRIKSVGTKNDTYTAEEGLTMGLPVAGLQPGEITENGLRAEQNLKPRVGYLHYNQTPSDTRLIEAGKALNYIQIEVN